MSEEGLLRLVSACAKIGARLGDGFTLGSLIDVAATRSKIRVVQALEARRAKITAAGFEIAADLRGRDECIVLSWPTNPMRADSFDPQFVEAVLAEQRAMEDA